MLIGDKKLTCLFAEAYGGGGKKPGLFAQVFTAIILQFIF